MIKRSTLKTGICLGLLILIASGHVFAVGIEDKTLSPYFLLENDDSNLEQFPLKATDVEVNINGVIADVVVRQVYENTGLIPINARYI